MVSGKKSVFILADASGWFATDINPKRQRGSLATTHYSPLNHSPIEEPFPGRSATLSLHRARTSRKVRRHKTARRQRPRQGTTRKWASDLESVLDWRSREKK